MNARIDSTLTLKEVAEHLEQWRRRKKNGERIPQQLWNEALGLVSTYGTSRVSRTLRLSYTELDKRRRIIEAEQRRQSPVEETAFVQIDPALVEQVPGPDADAGWMELVPLLESSYTRWPWRSCPSPIAERSVAN